MLEKSFPSADRIKSVYAFMRSCLREDIRPHKFVLCACSIIFSIQSLISLVLTPPRRDLKVSDASVKEKSLYELQLSPRSVLHFRFVDDDIESECPYLRFVAKMVTQFLITVNNGPPPLLSAILEGATALPMEPAKSEAVAGPSAEPPQPAEAETDTKKKEKKLERLLRLTSRS